MSKSHTFIQRRLVLLLVPVGFGVFLTGCGNSQVAKTPDDVKSFAGDPAAKARANAADQAKAQQLAATTRVSPPPVRR